MRTKVFIIALVALALAGYMVTGGVARGQSNTFSAILTGFEEVPTLSTFGNGHLEAVIDDAAETITFSLTYNSLSTPAMAAHIHLGARATNGGVSAFLCGGAGKPPCPPGNTNEAVIVSGVITPTDVIGPASQGLDPGVFGALTRAIREGATYANVHTTKFPGGEIRDQLRLDKPAQ